jgi:hypothetical protein
MMKGQMEVASRSMDRAARTIDLLAVIGRLAGATESGALIAKELGRWLGKEGLDENELEFFLHKTQALTMPNNQTNVQAFFRAVADGRPHPAVVPLWAQPSGSLGRYLSGDPLQNWMTSTISCLFRYHDEVFIRSAAVPVHYHSFAAQSGSPFEASVGAVAREATPGYCGKEGYRV